MSLISGLQWYHVDSGEGGSVTATTAGNSNCCWAGAGLLAILRNATRWVLGVFQIKPNLRKFSRFLFADSVVHAVALTPALLANSFVATPIASADAHSRYLPLRWSWGRRNWREGAGAESRRGLRRAG